MTKEQAIKIFREEVLPSIRERYGSSDKLAIQTEWNDFTDYLCKDGQITQNQYDTWSNPF